MEKISTKLIIGCLVFLGCVLFGSSYYVDVQKRDTVNKITIEIVEQEKLLSNIAEITDRNGADAVVEAIIKDCTIEKRKRFDTLLGKLGQLNYLELQETEQLFDACAGFFAERKAVMVARLKREYEVYKNLVDLLRLVDDTITVTQFKTDAWQRLVELEAKRSEAFDAQVRIQREIIYALLDGQSVLSPDIQTMLAEAQNVKEEASVTDQQIDAERVNLFDL